MTLSQLDQFITRSKDWLHVESEPELIIACMRTLHELFHLAGCVAIFRHGTTESVLYGPWDTEGIQQTSLNFAVEHLRTVDKTDHNDTTQWVVEPNLLYQDGASNRRSALAILSLRQGDECRLLFQGVHTSEEDLRICVTHISLLLEALQIIRRGKEIEQKLSSLLEFNPDGIYELNVNNELVYANSAFEHITGYPAQQLTDKHKRQSIVDPDFLSHSLNHLKRAWSGVSETHETVLRHKDGHQVHVTVKKIPIVVNGAIVGVYNVGKDITALKTMEMALREAEEKYRILVESSLMGVFVIQDGKIVYANPKFLDIFGYAREDVMNLDSRELVDDEYKPIVAENIRDRLKGTVSKTPFTMVGIRKDKTKVDVEVHGRLVSFGDHPAILCTLLDITERKKAEALLLKSEKLAVVGELAAGVAHEIRNPLTSLKGFVQLIPSIPEYQRYQNIMLSELERINEIVTEFLMAAKPGTNDFREGEVRDLLTEVITLMETQAIITNVQIRFEVLGTPPVIRCNPNQLKRVFMNLIKNSVESMPDGGVVRIQLIVRWSRLYVRIRDFGIGIPKERLKRIGEPFFTTKERGTGLGLMVSLKIIDHHQGALKFYSQLREGTSALISLPERQS